MCSHLQCHSHQRSQWLPSSPLFTTIPVVIVLVYVAFKVFDGEGVTSVLPSIGNPSRHLRSQDDVEYVN